MDLLSSLNIIDLDCKPWVANEFLDFLTCYELPENGLNKLVFHNFQPQCGAFDEELVTRLTMMCPHLTYLQLSWMSDLTETARISIASLFRQIIENNPPIQDLIMSSFSWVEDIHENIGELILESLLSSSINSITKLHLDGN